MEYHLWAEKEMIPETGSMKNKGSTKSNYKYLGKYNELFCSY